MLRVDVMGTRTHEDRVIAFVRSRSASISLSLSLDSERIRSPIRSPSSIPAISCLISRSLKPALWATPMKPSRPSTSGS
jgi:hypothetical protein